MRWRAMLTALVMPVVTCFNSPPAYLLRATAIRKLMVGLHPSVYDPTVEHCVPRSHYRPADGRRLGRDMHGLLCIPKTLNWQRSNYKLVKSENTTGWSTLEGSSHAFRHDQRRLFVPPAKYRGAYARSIGYVALTYPAYASLIHVNVLDLNVLVEWSDAHPSTASERIVHATVAAIQDNENPFFVNAQAAQNAVLDLMGK